LRFGKSSKTFLNFYSSFLRVLGVEKTHQTLSLIRRLLPSSSFKPHIQNKKQAIVLKSSSSVGRLLDQMIKKIIFLRWNENWIHASFLFLAWKIRGYKIMIKWNRINWMGKSWKHLFLLYFEYGIIYYCKTWKNWNIILKHYVWMVWIIMFLLILIFLLLKIKKIYVFKIIFIF